MDEESTNHIISTICDKEDRFLGYMVLNKYYRVESTLDGEHVLVSYDEEYLRKQFSL